MIGMDKFTLKKENAIILIVDIQEKLATVMTEKEQVISRCQILVEAAKLFAMPVIVTEQYPKGLGPTVREITEPIESYQPVEKITFDCCAEPAFSGRIDTEERREIILTGMETHICVLQTCLGLLRKGYTVHVVKDAVCSRTKQNFKTGIEMMRDAGAVITSTETVLFQLLEKAGTDEFRTLSKLVK